MNTRVALLALVVWLLVPFAQSADEPVKIVWYTYSHPDSPYRAFLETLAANADTYAQGDGLSWEITWWDTDDPIPDFTQFDLLVVQSGEGWSAGPAQGVHWNPDYSVLLEHGDAIAAARGNRTLLSITDGDFHARRGDTGNDAADNADGWDGALGHVVNCVNWAGTGTGLGILSWWDGEFSGGYWWVEDGSFLKDELDGYYIKKHTDNNPVLPASAADHPIHDGITAAGLANWSNSFHGAFLDTLPGYVPLLYSSKTAGWASIVASTGGAPLGNVHAIGNGTTASTTQSKFWHHDDQWWGVLSDGAAQAIHELQNGAFETRVEVDARLDTRVDVCWSDPHLFVLVAHATDSRLYKYRLDAGDHVLETGFPKSLDLGDGWAQANLGLDSAGRLWVAHEHAGEVSVLRSTASDHTTFAGAALATGDVGALAAFEAGLGLLFVDAGDLNWTARADADAPGTWDAVETVDGDPAAADDQVHAVSTADGTVLAATRGGGGAINLYVRDPATGWSGPHEVAPDGSHPTVAYDAGNDIAYLLYTDAAARIVFKASALADIATIGLETAQPLLQSATGVDYVTSTKQGMTSDTGLLAAATAGPDALWAHRLLPDGTAVPGDVLAQINFQPSGATPPAGHAIDAGEIYTTARGYGWNVAVGTREIGVNADQRLDTYAYVSNATTATWEYQVANGQYFVTVTAGSTYWRGIHTVTLEGETVIDATFTGSGEFVTLADHPVTITDGLLTMTIGGGGSKKTKVCALVLKAATGGGGTLPDPPEAPAVTATTSVAAGEAPLTVDFTGGAVTDNSPVDSWAWTFGDGDGATAQSPTHVYATAGNYTATLTVTDGNGLTGTASVVVVVTTPAPPPPPPIDPGEVVARINFQPSGSSVPTGYTADTGGTFDGTSGWDQAVATRERGYDDDPRKDTYAFVSNSTTATWEYALANGTYLVTLVAGSPRWSGIHTVALEETTVIDREATTQDFVTVTDHVVTVSDGRLTMDIGGGGSKKTKVCYLEIRKQ